MNQNNVKIILFLLAVLLVGGSYLYIFKPNKEEKQALDAEIAALETKLADLQSKEKDRDMYVAQTKEFNEQFDEIVAYFPADLNQEVSVMFIKGAEEARDGGFNVSSIGLGRPSEFYTLGSNTVAPATTDVAEGEEPVAVVETNTGYTCYQAAFPISYKGSYEGIKELIDYVMNYKYRMNISTINVNYDANADEYAGSITLNAYSVNGNGREADTIDVDVEEGVDNIFLGGNGAPAAKTYSYDADNGESIKTNYDVMVNLINANNTTGDGIVVSSGSEDTYVTSADNKVKTLEVTIFEEDGKTYIKYAIDDKDFTKELTGADVKIFVKSSERADADDTNGVKLNITNETSLNVFVKVDADDATSPRFSVGSKNGTVKVY